MNKEIAQQLFSRIPDGHANPLQRHPSAYVDRVFRRMVEDANKSGDCIINVGRGYYRPRPNDAVDEKEFNEYLAKDLSRARQVLLKRMKMRDAFRKRRDIEVFTDHTRKTG